VICIFENLRGYRSFFFGLTFPNRGGDRSYFLVLTFKGRRSNDFFFNKSQMACCSKHFFIMSHGLNELIFNFEFLFSKLIILPIKWIFFQFKETERAQNFDVKLLLLVKWMFFSRVLGFICYFFIRTVLF